MADNNSNDSNSIRRLNYKEEMELRMKYYHEHPDLITLFFSAYEKNKKSFHEAVEALNGNLRSFRLNIFNQFGDFVDIAAITLAQIEDIARQMNTCGYAFLESGQDEKEKKFYKYLPLRAQPNLDELFGFAFHRELETIQFHVDDFLNNSQLDLEMVNAIDMGEIELSISLAEKIVQGLYMPAFELIKHEYINYTVNKIQEFNPHRVFHQLFGINQEDKISIMEYVKYMIQGDHLITPGELDFTDRIVNILDIDNFEIDKFKENLTGEISLSELRPPNKLVPEIIRRQILGLVIECAYADKMLSKNEDLRILEIANLIIGNEYNSEIS